MKKEAKINAEVEYARDCKKKGQLSEMTGNTERTNRELIDICINNIDFFYFLAKNSPLSVEVISSYTMHHLNEALP